MGRRPGVTHEGSIQTPSREANYMSMEMIPTADLVGAYLRDISRHELLTKDNEIELARDIESGNEARDQLASSNGRLTPAEHERLEADLVAAQLAKRQFVNSNLRLVVSIAKKIGGSHELLDLVQEGNLGLIHAVDKFEWRKGYKFSTYATWWIRQAMSRGMANGSRTIRLPVHVGDRVTKVLRAANDIEGRTGREASLEDIADATGLSVKDVAVALAIPVSMVSLNKPVGDREGSELGDFLATESGDPTFEDATDPIAARGKSAGRASGLPPALAAATDRRNNALRRRRAGPARKSRLGRGPYPRSPAGRTSFPSRARGLSPAAIA